jgi:hypothetical protein
MGRAGIVQPFLLCGVISGCPELTKSFRMAYECRCPGHLGSLDVTNTDKIAEGR